MEINFKVPGKPFGKQRPRFSRRGRFSTTYTPQKTADYEKLTQLKCAEKMAEIGFEGWHDGQPVGVVIIAYFEIPKSYTKKRRAEIINGNDMVVTKPDWDNIGKIICDSCNGIVFHDDSQIAIASVHKKYTVGDPYVEVIFYNADE